MNALRVGIAGLGTVGRAVLGRLIRPGPDRAKALSTITVMGVSSRRRPEWLDGDIPWFGDAVELARSNSIDVFVELIGGAEGVTRQAVEAALAAGKGVVTANKALLAHHGLALAEMAEANGVALNFEAAVAGAIPIVKTLRESFTGNRVHRISGILNGTCNYILSRMESERLGFEVCLAEAQRLGYAEADPSFDIDGYDAAHKLALLASLAFGTAIDLGAIHIEGIRSITPDDLAAAEEFGYRIKLLGVAERTPQGIETRVHPTMVPRGSPLAAIPGVTNAVAVSGDAAGDLTLVGAGAGGEATASAVLADIVDIARGIRQLPFGQPVATLERVPRVAMQRHEGGYYVRLSVQDRIGAIAAIATRMAACQISFESIMQRRAGQGREASVEVAGFVPVVLITHATTETSIREALDAVEADGYIAGKPQLIRIERG